MFCMPLFVRCKGCKNEFPSTIQMADTSSWHKPIFKEPVNLICPECGTSFSYTKIEHFFR